MRRSRIGLGGAPHVPDETTGGVPSAAAALGCPGVLFLREKDEEVAKLVAGPRVYGAGPRVYICDECVAVANRLMEGAGNVATITPASNTAPAPASPR
jgi:hypothetical protein